MSSAGAAANTSLKRSTFKSRDIEELVDYYLHRPAARGLVTLLKQTPITPNQVTVISGLLGVAGGIAIGTATPANLWQVALGGVFLLLSVLFDCADGQLARLRGGGTIAGRALDGLMDSVPIVAALFGFVFFLVNAGYDPTYVWLLSLVAGLSWRWHAEWYDLAKCLYLTNTEVRTSDLVLSPDEISKHHKRAVAEGRKADSFVLWFFAHYTSKQHQGKTGHSGLDLPAMSTPAERATYRRVFSRYMRWWSWNGIGTHHFMIWIAALLTPLVMGSVLWVYWVFVVGYNVLTFALIRWSRALEAQLATELGRDGSLAEEPPARTERALSS